MKNDLVKRLVDDFVKQFPEATRQERVLLFSKLNMMEVSALELLVSQIK